VTKATFNPRLAVVWAWLCCAATLIGCGDNVVGPSATTQENIAGIWNGRVSGVSQGVTLDGTITLTLEQTIGNLTGGYSVVATLTNPTQQSSLQGSVVLTGSVAQGTNPSVSFTTRSVPCPALAPELWSGAFASRDGVLTISGTAHVITATCQIVLSYPQTIRLTR
jgi:hypothetical protein